jgi:hypothetical protein
MLINLSSFNILSLVDLGSKHEINMQNGFSSNFPLPPCPHIPIGRHPLIEIRRQTTFHFSGISCYSQNKSFLYVNQRYLPTPSSYHNTCLYNPSNLRHKNFSHLSMWLQILHFNVKLCHLNLSQILPKGAS